MKISIIITDDQGEVLEQLTVTGDTKKVHDTAIPLAAAVRDHIENRFEVDED